MRSYFDTSRQSLIFARIPARNSSGMVSVANWTCWQGTCCTPYVSCESSETKCWTQKPHDQVQAFRSDAGISDIRPLLFWMYIDDEGNSGTHTSGPSYTAAGTNCLFEHPSLVNQCNDYIMGKWSGRSEANNHFGQHWSGTKADGYHVERWRRYSCSDYRHYNRNSVTRCLMKAPSVSRVVPADPVCSFASARSFLSVHFLS